MFFKSNAKLAERIEILEAAVEALSDLVDRHERRLEAMRTCIVLRDGDSPFSVVLRAGPDYAGVWAEDASTGSSATVQNQRSQVSPVVGVYGRIPGGEAHLAMEAALFYDPNSDGGTLQLIDEGGRIHWGTGRDFGRGLELRRPDQG